MKTTCKHLVMVVALVGATLLPALGWGYSLMLPNPMPSPALPYCSGSDGWGGPAVVQTAANTCKGATGRLFIPQAQLWTSIQAHNRAGEPAPGWYSDPQGVTGALEDPALAICGGWVDISNTNRDTVLGWLLYYVKAYKYMGIVSTGPFEHWQIVRGFWTDAEPAGGAAVTLNEIYLYDPDYPCETRIVSGGTWSSDAAYWGGPVNRAGSQWHNKYVAVAEPPTLELRVRVREHLKRGRILPFERAFERLQVWAAESEAARDLGLREVAQGRAEHVLVRRDEGSYYLVSLKLRDGRHADIILNAYSGDFEELRLMPAARRLPSAGPGLQELLRGKLARSNARLVETADPEVVLDPEISGLDRYSPVQRAQIKLVEPGTTREVEKTIVLDREGNVLRGLEHNR